MVDYKQHIESNPKVMLGKPIIKSTRITVEAILNKISGGFSFDDILEMYPHLKKQDILASVAYAAAIMASEELITAA